ncbi:hypothetical protein [Streptomyces sp. NBC_01198]|uniref:hypothetical protein n=1 Tax=Streptomyces sp. NBC_01198 TaxID=2903769 RepID=UPI002E11D6E1|nr:hypothetical protein OG702_26705 [Streptomyces sp. NBC_01198]
MILSVSALLLFGIASYVAVRSRATSFGGAVVVFLFGFYAASSGGAKPINQLMASVAQTIAQMR